MPDATGAEVEVEKVRTTPAEGELCVALDRASRDVLGEPLTRDAMSVLVAQTHIETGRLKSCFNFNIGNVRDLPGDGWDFVLLYTWEMLEGRRWEGFGAFRAYPSLEVGVEQHIRFLTDFKRRPGYRTVWERVLAGDPSGTAYAMKAARYFTADEHVYARALESLAAEFLSKTRELELPDRLDTTEPAPPTPYVPSHLRLPIDPLVDDPRDDLTGPIVVDDVLELVADSTLAALAASHLRGFHRPTHVVDATPTLVATESSARLRRAMLSDVLTRV